MAVPRQSVVNCRAEVFILVYHFYLAIMEDFVSLGRRVFPKVIANIFILCCIQAQVRLIALFYKVFTFRTNLIVEQQTDNK